MIYDTNNKFYQSYLFGCWNSDSDEPLHDDPDDDPRSWNADPTTWEDYGMAVPSLRFFVGQRVEYHYEEGWFPGIIAKLGESPPSIYQILTEVGTLVVAPEDYMSYVVPLGLAKTSIQICSNCGVDSSSATLKNCGACKRVKYCSKKCQAEDMPNHKPICKAIIAEKKRLTNEAKKIISETKTSDDLTSQLILAVEQRNITLVKRILKKKPDCFDINAFYIDAATNQPFPNNALAEACNRGYVEITKHLLLVDGIDVNKVNRNGHNPLGMACQMGHVSTVALLLNAKGIDVNQAVVGDDNGGTALHFACEGGHISVVDLLVQAKGINLNPQLTNEDRCTPLFFACQNVQRTAVVERLLRAEGIDVNVLNGRGATPLIIASHCGHTEAVRLLLQNPAIDLLVRDNDGDSALDCVESGEQHQAIVQLLEAAACAQKSTMQHVL